MRYSSRNNIPAFGGVVNPNGLQEDPGLFEQEAILKTDTMRVYSNSACMSKFNKYLVLGENKLLWTGGIRYKSEQNLSSFDFEAKDHKFVYLESSNTKLELYTDHYSKIPLFYSLENSVLYFATSLDFLLELKGKNTAKTNYIGLLFYYNFGFSGYEEYLIENIKLLSGGKRLKFDIAKNEVKIESYRNFFKIQNNKGHSNDIESNKKLIDQYLLKATQESIKSFNNIGIALSGGVDSGYLAQKISEGNKNFNAYTIGFKDDYNEFERIDFLSKKLNFKAKKIIISDIDILDNYLEVCKYSSFPVGFNNSILNLIYHQASIDGVDVMFDGDGADRLFLGMNKHLQLQKILKLYDSSKSLNLNKTLPKLLKLITHPSAKKLNFYFQKFNDDFPFYGERKLSDSSDYNRKFEAFLNDLAIPNELKEITANGNKWLFFTLFSVYYTPAFFFHTPYELQLRYGIVSNPQFWSDDLVNLALNIPVKQKLHKKTTKLVLREAAKLRINDGYWNLPKIGLQNSYNYLKKSALGKDFIKTYAGMIKKTDDYYILKELMPENKINAERLIPYFIWKQQLV